VPDGRSAPTLLSAKTWLTPESVIARTTASLIVGVSPGAARHTAEAHARTLAGEHRDEARGPGATITPDAPTTLI